MSGTTWTKFFWSDWQSDPALRLCSYSARGLWMDMLCIAAAHDPIGYVAVAGRALDETAIARMTGGLESEVRVLLGELNQNGVFSRDRQGRIYSRRMVSDAKKAAIAKKNGKSGGNPSLRKDWINSPLVNQPDKAVVKTQEPLSKIQLPSEVIPPPPSASAFDWKRAWMEAKSTIGDMGDFTQPAMLHVGDLRSYLEPASGEPCVWADVMEGIAHCANRQRSRGRGPIKAWSWAKDDIMAMRDRRLHAQNPNVVELQTRPQTLTDRIASDNAEARRRVLEEG